MGREVTPGKPTARRYTDGEKAQAVRLVRQLRAETGQRHGPVRRVAEQLGYGVEPRSARGSVTGGRGQVTCELGIGMAPHCGRGRLM